VSAAGNGRGVGRGSGGIKTGKQGATGVGVNGDGGGGREGRCVKGGPVVQRERTAGGGRA